MVKQLYGDVMCYAKHHRLGANDGMKRTREMAEQLADPWERLMAIWTNVCGRGDDAIACHYPIGK